MVGMLLYIKLKRYRYVGRSRDEFNCFTMSYNPYFYH